MPVALTRRAAPLSPPLCLLPQITTISRSTGGPTWRGAAAAAQGDE